jgi:hypothetical protein
MVIRVGEKRSGGSREQGAGKARSSWSSNSFAKLEAQQLRRVEHNITGTTLPAPRSRLPNR